MEESFQKLNKSTKARKKTNDRLSNVSKVVCILKRLKQTQEKFPVL